MNERLLDCLRSVRLLANGVPWNVVRNAGTGFRCGPGSHFRPRERILIGRNVFIGRFAHIAAPCIIKDDVMLASFVSFIGGDHRYDVTGLLLSKSGRGSMEPIVVEEEAWIGHGSIVLAGVTIGRGAIVAAGSVVTKNVEPCTIWGSPPARFVKQRFPDSADKARHLQFLDERYPDSD